MTTLYYRCADAQVDCLNKSDYDHPYGNEDGRHDYDDGFLDGGADTPGSDHHDTPFEHPCHSLKKVLSGGTFYYSTKFDLTNRLQDRLVQCSPLILEAYIR